MFSLAHLSDVHLGPLPKGASWQNFRLKRIVGKLSWELRRRQLHDPVIAAMIAADIHEMAPDHVALTGDVINISAHAEFPHAARWIGSLGVPDKLTFVPGNHDCYVHCGWDYGLSNFAPWMSGDMNVNDTQVNEITAVPFPFVRLRKNVALIALNSAVPRGLRDAGGRLGPVQLQSLQLLLRDIRERGYARIVLIHHPPLPGLAVPRKALDDATELQAILEREGAELVLHGHNHHAMLNPLKTRFGTCNVIGVASASMNGSKGLAPGAWNLYRIVRQEGRWRTEVTIRAFDPGKAVVNTVSEFSLSS